MGQHHISQISLQKWFISLLGIYGGPSLVDIKEPPPFKRGLCSVLCHGRLSSLILFIIFMNRISWHSQGVQGLLRIASMLFVDGVALLASSETSITYWAGL